MLSKVGDVNIQYKVLNELDDKSLVSYCQVNRKARDICNDQRFWFSRIKSRFSYIPLDILRKYKKDRSWSDYYIELRSVEKDHPSEILNNHKNYTRSDILLIPIEKRFLCMYKDDVLNTIMRRFIKNGDVEVVEILLNKGYNINQKKDFNELTPLMLASLWGQEDIVKLLLDRGAKVDLKNNENRTALGYAGDNTNIITMLLDKGADINSQDLSGYTPLMIAAIRQNEDTTKFLLEKGADVNITNVDGETAFILAVRGRNSLDIIKLLIDHGADLTIKDIRGRTAFDYAFMRGYNDIVALLENSG